MYAPRFAPPKRFTPLSAADSDCHCATRNIMPFQWSPLDVLVDILSYLEARDILALQRVSVESSRINPNNVFIHTY